MGVERYSDGWTFRVDEHPAYYGGSSFDPPAPEFSVGEVLVGAVYRGLVLGIHENEVALEEASELPARLATEGALGATEWSNLLLDEDLGLGSPRFRKQPDELAPISPFVPEIARYSCVLGRSGRRWNPFNLFLSTVYSGRPGTEGTALLERVFSALSVGDSDDLLARLVESQLTGIRDESSSVTGPALPAPWPPTSRRSVHAKPHTPAERFCQDLDAIVALKKDQTRKQWIVLFEALLRVGLPLHYLWMCRVNDKAWMLVREALDHASFAAPTADQVERVCWTGHVYDESLLEFGEDSRTFVLKWLRRYLIARIGFSVVLYAAESAGLEFEQDVLRAGDSDQDASASEKLTRFIAWVGSHSGQLNATVERFFNLSVVELATSLADSKPDYLNCKKGTGNNAKEFLRYTMGQLQPKRPELKAYDQSYLTAKHGRSGNSPWIVTPGPALLLMLVHGACSEAGLPHVSLNGFRQYLADYGLHAPTGQLSDGQTGRRLEELGVAIESPDAGGGRMLLDPFVAR